MHDMDLFLHRYAPATTQMDFFEIAYPDLVTYLYQRKHDLAIRWESPEMPKQIETGKRLEEKLQQLLPLTHLNNKTLISSTQSAWCVYIPNNIHGGDVHSQPDFISEELGIRRVTVVMVKDIPKNQPGSMQFVYTDGTQAKWIPSDDPNRGHHETPGRVVLAHHESRWEFETWGEPFPFEEIERYAAKRIKDRLTPDMIGRYCSHFGIDLFNPDFYTGEACILETYAHPDAERVWQYPNL